MTYSAVLASLYVVVHIHRSFCSSLLYFLELLFCFVMHVDKLYIVLEVRSLRFS